ncbi:MAG: CAP domain-containing protein [Chloroflexaceae bacterium]|nr:CAP domain-containing protein [Chloroflexaceae bacterium]
MLVLPRSVVNATAIDAPLQLIDLINQQRTLHGCPVLSVAPELSLSAYSHAEDMAINDFFNHIGSNGSHLGDRATAAGYTYMLVAENMLAGSEDLTLIVDQWMASPTHRDNLLNCDLSEIGVGYVYQEDDQANVQMPDATLSGPFHHYWVIDLGTRAP